MVTRVSKNVVCVKNVPSNIICEAFFILKENTENVKNEKISEEIVMNEIEGLLNEYGEKLNNEKEEKRRHEIEAKIKLRAVKRKNLILITMFIVACLIIAGIKM